MNRHLVFLCLASLVIALPAVAQDKSKSAGAPDMEAMMKEWAKYATPGEPHRNLEKFAGKWDATVKMWMDPSQPPMESKGTADFQMVLGGRWLDENFKGEFMGQPFEGHGMWGYDLFKKTYVSTWRDNTCTSLMTSTGTFDAAGKQYTLTGIMDEPTTGERDKKFKQVVKWTGPDQFVVEMYDTIPGKGETKVMEIAHTRAK